MKDKAIEGIASARQKDRLANDAAVVDRNKKGVGKRTNISSKSSGLSSTKTPSLSINQLNKKNLLNNVSSSKQDAEAKKRLQNRQKMQNQAIKVAEKIPVASKYAKMAKMAEKIKNAKTNKGNPLKNMFGGNSDKEPTPAEAEEAMGAEQRGEEYKSDEAEGKFTVLTQKKLKLFAIIFSGGAVITILFLSVIFLSSILDSGKEAYLASHDNPTEAEIESAYNSNAAADSLMSNNSSNSNNQNSNISSGNSSSNKNNIIYVGDSRMVGLCLSVNLSSKEDCSIAKGSMGYNWFSSTALSSIKSKLNSKKNSTVVIYMGTNDLLNNGAPESYAKDYNQLAKDYNDSSIIIVSVTEIDDDKAVDNGYQVKNSQVVNFNNSLKKSLSSDVKYCDVYSKINNNFNTSDGIHYTSDTYKNIYQQIQNCL